MPMATVTVVVPTFNRIERLKKVLGALERQDYPRDQFDVVVVSDGSTDGTHEYLAHLAMPLRLRVVEQHNQGPAAARNAGIAHASGEYVLFIDDDVLPMPNLISEHMASHGGRDDLVVLGPMLTPDDFAMSPWIAWEQAMLLKQYSAMERGVYGATERQFYTGNTSLMRRHLVRSGGFDERFRRAEDIELAYRLRHDGVTFVFNPRAIGLHYAERSFASWLSIPYAYGRNEVIFSRERGSDILDFVRGEFLLRNPLIRSIVRLCLDRPALSAFAQQGFKSAADAAFALGLRRVARAGYSAIFNLRYYQGVADELGGRGRFLVPAPGSPGPLAEH